MILRCTEEDATDTGGSYRITRTLYRGVDGMGARSTCRAAGWVPRRPRTEEVMLRKPRRNRRAAERKGRGEEKKGRRNETRRSVPTFPVCHGRRGDDPAEEPAVQFSGWPSVSSTPRRRDDEAVTIDRDLAGRGRPRDFDTRPRESRKRCLSFSHRRASFPRQPASAKRNGHVKVKEGEGEREKTKKRYVDSRRPIICLPRTVHIGAGVPDSKRNSRTLW